MSILEERVGTVVRDKASDGNDNIEHDKIKRKRDFSVQVSRQGTRQNGDY